MCRKTMEMALPGERKRGRSKTRWKDCLRNDMATVGATDENTRSRNVCRSMVHMAATPPTYVRQARRRRITKISERGGLTVIKSSPDYLTERPTLRRCISNL